MEILDVEAGDDTNMGLWMLAKAPLFNSKE
jgi:hypothetical protein